MKLMKHVRNAVILSVVGTGAICLAGYVAYQVLLDDEAKEGIRELTKTISASYGQISNLINDRIGTIMDEDLVAQNRQAIRDAWADLGYA